jgi:hypothetical protein
MLKVRTYVVAALALGIGGLVISTTNVGSAFAQGALKPIEALIVNSSSRPVPVAGRVSVSNAPGVQPYTCTLELLSSNVFFSETCPEVVPAGKRLVIEHVSADVLVPLGAYAFVSLRASPQAPPVDVRVPLVREFSGIGDGYVGSVPVRYYVESGQAPAISRLNSSAATVRVTATVIGYLIDTP